ncbi:histidine triad nucleotide-binding protein [Aeromicrobium sp. CnD17-E]|uniref:histidine triad nucleotide-binding protein n=1 Tax=Aeromicrobium sp. CnD17-E TaxID=2954487 RepID=UPI0020984752|nr:histidine triad nucleotide-binding protein [Aeromicrobium sp. CnD17-E]MCO7239866.1 histidine triad nucleotide-binding protein [Aeromicrobium sp. CnD17-E]
MSPSADCLFCKIVEGEVPADVVAQDEHAVAFRDISPQAPTHVLVIPRVHQPDVGSLAEAEPEAVVGLLRLARRVADEAGGSYRLVFNTGADAHQTVFHCHGHVLAGRSLGWPPG